LGRPVEILLVEDNPSDVLMLREVLAEAQAVSFQVTHVERLSAALQQLAAQRFDVVLLDLSLPDSLGLDTFAAMRAQAPHVPIVVLTALDDEALAVQAVQAGAQDYLVKGQPEGVLLMRALRYAIERHQMLLELRAMSLVDELTGLYNRRGFSTLAAQQMRWAARQQQGFVLFFVDLDGMKWINDTFGHQVGDQALREVAEVIRESFRQSDIIARLGGDEFAILAVAAHRTSIEMFTTRVDELVQARNARAVDRFLVREAPGVFRPGANAAHVVTLQFLITE